MDDHSAQFAEQLRKNPAMLKALLQSPDGQALIQMLSRGNQGAQLRSAVRDASRGNPAEAVRLVNQFLETSEGAALAQRLQRQFGK